MESKNKTISNREIEILKLIRNGLTDNEIAVELNISPNTVRTHRQNLREKLDASKLLYYYCVDTQNYLNISDVFSYKLTESELKDFVEKQK